jgi:hypothetical protein
MVMKKRALLLSVLCLISITCKETTTIYQPFDTLTDPAVKPAVIYTFPGSNSIGPYYGFSMNFTVRFNKLMDLSSLRHAIHFLSPVGDLLPDTCLISINQGDVASITPIRSNLIVPFLWKVGRSYILRIDSTAKDISDNNLIPSFELTFTPEPYFRVTSISPPSGDIDVKASRLQIIFNALVDMSIRSHIIITPSVSGSWQYRLRSLGVYDSSQIIFQNNSSFDPGKTYTVLIESNAVDKDGNSLSGGFTSSFTTVPFYVTNTSPNDGSINWSPSSRNIYIYFNDTLDISTVPESFSIIPPIAGEFSYSSNLKTFYYTVLNNFLQETVYTVTIDTSIRSKSQERISQPYTFSFMTGTSNSGGSLHVYLTDPADGDTNDYYTTSVRIYFNTALDTASARHGFTITPSIDGLLSFPYSNIISFSPIQSFSMATTYTVTLSTSITSKSGVPLESAYIFSFTTVPFKVTGSYPSDGETHFYTTGSIRVSTSYAFDTSTVRTAFNITPSVSGSFSMYSDQKNFYFNPLTPLEPYTIYSVTISSALQSKSGVPLVSPYTFTFATGE